MDRDSEYVSLPFVHLVRLYEVPHLRVGPEGLVENVGAAVLSAGNHEAGDNLFTDLPVAPVLAGGREVDGGASLSLCQFLGQKLNVVIAIVL